MVFGFQVVCLLVTLVTVFAYIAHHVYSREHRLLPLFLGVIAVFDFYRIVLMLTGAVGLFAQLENLLILTLTTVISYYAVDYLHIKLPHAIHVGLFLYLIVLLILIFLHFDQPDTYVVAFRSLRSLTRFLYRREPYIHMRHSIFPNATASRMPLCLSPFVCRLWWAVPGRSNQHGDIPCSWWYVWQVVLSSYI